LVGQEKIVEIAKFYQDVTEHVQIPLNVSVYRDGPDFYVIEVAIYFLIHWHIEWTDSYKSIAICSPNCNKQSGYCTKPGTCRCKVGWVGNNCSEVLSLVKPKINLCLYEKIFQCHPYPGCKNGNCTRPWVIKSNFLLYYRHHKHI